MTDTWQPTFADLDAPALPVADIENAAMVTLRRLHELDLLGPEHALTCQLILDLARVIGISTRTGKAAAVAMAAKQLVEALDTLPKPEVAIAGGDLWERIVETISE